jgi:hypothetical protein
MSVNGALTMIGFASQLICVAIGCKHSYMTYTLPLLAKEKAIYSLPDSETEC